VATFTEWCATLVRDTSGIRAVAEEAQVPPENVNWNGTPRSIWASLLAEERNADKVGSVFRVLALRYPENEEFFCSGLAYVQNVEKSKRQPTMSEVSTGITTSQDGVAVLIHELGDSFNSRFDDLQGDVRRLEGKVESRFQLMEMALSRVSVMTPTRRNFWMLGFFLFCLPAPLFFYETRVLLNITTAVALSLTVTAWSIAFIAFMYGIGAWGDVMK